MLTGATDYRYAHRQTGQPAKFEPFELQDELAERCGTLGLDMAGIDLRITSDGETCCFEVNPSPVYSYYEAHTSQPMAMALVTCRGKTRRS